MAITPYLPLRGTKLNPTKHFVAIQSTLFTARFVRKKRELTVLRCLFLLGLKIDSKETTCQMMKKKYGE